MAALKYKVELNESERTRLKQIASRGKTSARKVRRALVLLKADEGLTDRDIASGLLKREVSALEHERNEAVAVIDWRFSTQDARTKLQHIYPSCSA